MRTLSRTHLSVVATLVIVAFSNLPPASGGTVTGFDLYKSHFFAQTDSTQPVIPADSAFSTNVYLDAAISSAEAIVFLPGATVGTVLPASGTNFTLRQDFAAEVDLDINYPPGTYTYTLNSPDLTPVTGETASLNAPLLTEIFPNVPYFTNFAAIQHIDTTRPFSFKWNSLVLPSPPVNGTLQFNILDISANENVVGLVLPDNTATSYDIPVNALRPGHRYRVTVYFIYGNFTAGTGFAGKTGFLGYDNVTDLTFTTDPLPTDFNGDGSPDWLLFNPSTGQTNIWYFNGPAFQSSAPGPTVPAGWSVVAVGDFNQDGHPDYVLYNSSTRRTAVWYLDGVTHRGGAAGPTLPVGWSLVAVADLNGDGQLDYVLFNSATRRTAVWYLNGTTYASGAAGPTLPAGWSLAAVADLNGDGQPDFILFNASTRRTLVWYLNGVTHNGGAAGPTLPLGWSLEGVEDFTADGQPDFVLFNGSTRKTAIWHLNGATHNGGLAGPDLPAGYDLVAP